MAERSNALRISGVVWRRLAPAAAVGWIAILLSCSPDLPLSDSQLAEVANANCGELTYQNFAADFFAEYCLRCHNEQFGNDDFARTDAPTGVNFNRLDGVRAFKNRIRLRAGVQGDMPPLALPVPHPSDEERIRLIQWIDCGTPADDDVEN